MQPARALEPLQQPRTGAPQWTDAGWGESSQRLLPVRISEACP